VTARHRRYPVWLALEAGAVSLAYSDRARVEGFAHGPAADRDPAHLVADMCAGLFLTEDDLAGVRVLNWQQQPLIEGAYPAFSPGQLTSFGAVAARAGSRTGVPSRRRPQRATGTMEGAVRGHQAASWVLDPPAEDSHGTRQQPRPISKTRRPHYALARIHRRSWPDSRMIITGGWGIARRSVSVRGPPVFRPSEVPVVGAGGGRQQRIGIALIVFRAMVMASAHGQFSGSRRRRRRPLCTTRPGVVKTLSPQRHGGRGVQVGGVDGH
jgi:hypothetical protein